MELILTRNASIQFKSNSKVIFPFYWDHVNFFKHRRQWDIMTYNSIVVTVPLKLLQVTFVIYFSSIEILSN